MPKEKETKRFDTIDILKGLGILMMVAGHAGAPLKSFISLFHMAIFFIASGFCYSNKNSINIKSFIEFCKRRIKKLWFTYFFWTSLFILLNNIFIRINVYTNNADILKYATGKFVGVHSFLSLQDRFSSVFKAIFFQSEAELGGAFWFLATLFEISICYCLIDYLVRKLFKDKHIIIIQGIISLLFLCIGYYMSVKGIYFYGLNRMFSYYSLFYLGLIIKKSCISTKDRTDLIHIIIFVISTLLLFVLKQIGSVSIGSNIYTNPLFLIVVSFVGWQFTYEIAYFIGKINIFKKIWTIIGQNTLPVVVLHFLCFKIVNLIEVLVLGYPLFVIAAFPILHNNGLWWLAYIIVGLSVPVVLNLIRKKAMEYIKNKLK